MQGIKHPIAFTQLKLKGMDTTQKQSIPFMTNTLKWEWLS